MKTANPHSKLAVLTYMAMKKKRQKPLQENFRMLRLLKPLEGLEVSKNKAKLAKNQGKARRFVKYLNLIKII